MGFVREIIKLFYMPKMRDENGMFRNISPDQLFLIQDQNPRRLKARDKDFRVTLYFACNVERAKLS